MTQVMYQRELAFTYAKSPVFGTTDFAIRTEKEELIGGCAFDDLAYSHRAEIGYWLAKPYWGQGIMTDVVRAACALAIAERKLVRITAHVFDFNAASARVLERPDSSWKACWGNITKRTAS